MLNVITQIATFMGPTSGSLSAPDGPHVGPMKLAIMIILPNLYGGLTKPSGWISNDILLFDIDVITFQCPHPKFALANMW